MRLTIDLDTSNSQALALLNYIKSLDFVFIREKDEDSNVTLTNEQITLVKNRKKKHKNGESKSFSWEDIKKELYQHEKI